MLLESSLTGCDDDWNLLDHFDPTMDMRRLQKHFMYLRTTYNALQDVLTSYSMEIEPSLSSSRVRTTLHLKWASGLYHVRIQGAQTRFPTRTTHRRFRMTTVVRCGYSRRVWVGRR